MSEKNMEMDAERAAARGPYGVPKYKKVIPAAGKTKTK